MKVVHDQFLALRVIFPQGTSTLYLLRWCKGTHDGILTRALTVRGANASHHRLQAHAFKFHRVCLCTTEEATRVRGISKVAPSPWVT